MQIKLLPTILQKLEKISADYIRFFANGGRLYRPSEVSIYRDPLIQELESAHLLNCEIHSMIFNQIAKTYPNLSQCLHAAECLWTEKNFLIQEEDLSLDWLMFNLINPRLKIIDYAEFRDHCLEVCRNAKLQYPYTLLTEFDGHHYRLITGWDQGKSKLLTPIEIHPDRYCWAIFEDIYKPTYLELVAWASVDYPGHPAQEWDVVVDWGRFGEDLDNLSCDPTLPQATTLKDCLSYWRKYGR